MAILRIFIICLLLLIWLSRKKDLGCGLLAASFLLGISYLDFGTVLKSIFITFYSKEAIELILSLSSIYYFMGIWRYTGGTTALVRCIESTKIHPFLALILPSSLVGLLPIIGGALVSAPLMQDSCLAEKVNPAKKTFLNYWFRHIWEYILPTYPTVIVVATMLDISYTRLFSLNFPLTLTAIVGGTLFGYVKIKHRNREIYEKNETNSLKMGVTLIPLLLIMVLVLVLKIPLFITMAIIITGMLVFYRVKLPDAGKIFKETFTFTTISLVWGIVSFKALMDKTGIITEVSHEFVSAGIPMVAIIIALPFIVGFLTGIAVAYVSITFPLFLGYLTANPMYIPLAYVSGYLGILLTPMHYCLSLTREYFKAEWKPVYKLLLGPCILLILGTGIWILILKNV